MTSPNKPPTHVELSEPNPAWKMLFIEAAKEIKAILGNNCMEVHHIGSTAIPNIYAKPIIDILPVVKDIERVDAFNPQFEALGYICMGEFGMPGRRFFWRSKLKRTHNIHIFQDGSPEILRHVAFKDFLIAHPDYAKAYSILKCCLAEVFADDIQHYLQGKDPFIQLVDYKTGHIRPTQLSATDNINIKPYNPAWPKFAKAEIKAIKTIADQLHFVAIEHIGSTAVPSLASKAIIDILITVPSIEYAQKLIAPLETLGYIFWNENPDKAHLRFFKGMPPYGEKRTHHIHIVEEGNDMGTKMRLFRDILRRDEKIRRDYESLKINLSGSLANEREVYTEKKGEFIESVLRNL